MAKHPKRKSKPRIVEAQADRERRAQADMLRRAVRQQKQVRALSGQLRRAKTSADDALRALWFDLDAIYGDLKAAAEKASAF